MASKSVGIVKALQIVGRLDVETLAALEEVLSYYETRKAIGVLTGMRVMKQHRILEEDE
jgi:hypothetical protein